MKTLSVADFKAQFSHVITELRNGNEVAITYGRKREPLATIVPQSKMATPHFGIPLGDLAQQGWSYDMIDFAMTDEDLLGA